ncbi:FixH family protein [Roseovarius salinarum]|uniref:FixH family protein n=1 Tax=Roseovarius salinarum TaxID=1981892 RepID=UPI0018E430D0|nr:FixH family protein [Roseovarius salinarum]
MGERRITGRHVFIGFAAAFGVIIAVNGYLAWSAVQTFPGLEVKNSYVASQTFDDRRAAQEALGWTVEARHSDGMLRLSITDDTGLPARVETLKATVGRATHVAEDVEPDLTFDGEAFVAPLELGDGNWDVRMVATAADGTEFRKRLELIKE